MTTAVQELLDSFDALSDAEKHEAGTQLLERILRAVSGELPNEELVTAAEGLFLELDAGEAGDAQP